MRKYIVLCLSLAAVSMAGIASANVGSSGHSMVIASDALGNTPVSAPVPSVQAIFSATAGREGLAGGSAQVTGSAGVPETWGFTLGEQGSTESMLLAGALLVVALVIRRISG